MPAEQGPVGWDAERFATAVEQGTPPGSVADDPGLARDLEIAAMLGASGDAYSPRPDEKARARQQLMARLAGTDDAGPMTAAVPDLFAEDDTAVMTVVAPAPVEGRPDGEDIDAAPAQRRPGRHASRHAMPSRPPGRPRGRARVLGKRAVLIGAAAVLALIAGAGGSIFASRDALPGDALYGVKRVAESAGLAMTFDDAAKGRRQLQLATRRIDEVEQLASREPAATRPELFQSTIKDFDSSTGEGSRTLLASEDAGGTAALGDLRAWAGEQAARLSVLRSALPSTALPGADSSISLLDRILGRTEALGDRSSCTQVTSGVVDDLGPLPAQGACTPRPSGSPGGSPGSSGRTSRTGVAGSGPVRPDRSATGGDEPSTTPGPSAPAGEDSDGGGSGGSGGSGSGGSGGSGSSGSGGGLLPGIINPDKGSPAPTTTSAPSGGDVSVPVPLPLVPPIHLPPLLPGQPGITIG